MKVFLIISNLNTNIFLQIIILDIHRLPVGFYFDDEIRRKRHEMLVNLIFRELYEYAVDFAEVSVPHSKANIHLLDGPRMKDIWETGKRLIICYPEESITKGTQLNNPAIYSDR